MKKTTKIQLKYLNDASIITFFRSRNKVLVMKLKIVTVIIKSLSRKFVDRVEMFCLVSCQQTAELLIYEGLLWAFLGLLYRLSLLD